MKLKERNSSIFVKDYLIRLEVIKFNMYVECHFSRM
jgi:hypothetical protein